MEAAANYASTDPLITGEDLVLLVPDSLLTFFGDRRLIPRSSR
jgi:hypothetical protein